MLRNKTINMKQKTKTDVIKKTNSETKTQKITARCEKQTELI